MNINNTNISNKDHHHHHQNTKHMSCTWFPCSWSSGASPRWDLGAPARSKSRTWTRHHQLITYQYGVHHIWRFDDWNDAGDDDDDQYDDHQNDQDSKTHLWSWEKWGKTRSALRYSSLLVCLILQYMQQPGLLWTTSGSSSWGSVLPFACKLRPPSTGPSTWPRWWSWWFCWMWR